MSTEHEVYKDGDNELEIRESGYRLSLSMTVVTEDDLDQTETYDSRTLSPDEVIEMAAKMLYPVFVVTADDREVTQKFKAALEKLGFSLREK